MGQISSNFTFQEAELPTPDTQTNMRQLKGLFSHATPQRRNVKGKALSLREALFPPCYLVCAFCKLFLYVASLRALREMSFSLCLEE